MHAHESVRTNQSISRDVHLIQKNHMQANTERSLNQVYIVVIKINVFLYSINDCSKQRFLINSVLELRWF